MQDEDSNWRFLKPEKIKLFEIFREKAVEAVSPAVISRLLSQEGKSIPKWHTLRKNLERRVKEEEARHLTTRIKNKYPIEDSPDHFDLVVRYTPYRDFSQYFLEKIVHFLDCIDKPKGFTILQAGCLTGTEIRVLSKFYNGLEMHFEGYDKNPGMTESAKKIKSKVRFYTSRNQDPPLSEMHSVNFIFSRVDIGDLEEQEGAFDLEVIIEAAKRVKPGGWMAIPAAEMLDEECLDELRQFAIYYSSSDFVVRNQAGQNVFLNYFYVGHPVKQISFSLDIPLDNFSSDDAYNLFELFARRTGISIEGTKEEIFSDYPALLEDKTIGFGEVGKPWSYDIDATGREIVISYFISLPPRRFARLKWNLEQDIMSYYALRRKITE